MLGLKFVKGTEQAERKWVGQHTTVWVRGSETALRKRLLISPVGSKEFDRLGAFMASASTGHYAERVRSELLDVLSKDRASNNLQAFRTMACGGTEVGFVADFITTNLSKSCADENQWTAAVIEFAKHAHLDLKHWEGAQWWGVHAAKALSYRPSTARSVTVGELNAMQAAYRQRQKDDDIQVDAPMVLTSGISEIVVFVFDVTEGYATTLTSPDPELRQSPCFAKRRADVGPDGTSAIQPLCMARLVLHAPPESPMRVLAIENVRPMPGEGPRQ